MLHSSPEAAVYYRMPESPAIEKEMAYFLRHKTCAACPCSPADPGPVWGTKRGFALSEKTGACELLRQEWEVLSMYPILYIIGAIVVLVILLRFLGVL